MDNTQSQPGVVTRTLKVPVAEIISGGTKQEFYRDLRGSIKKCVAASNRCITECAVIDREAYIAVAAGEKVPKKPKLYTYPVLKGMFPGCANVAATVARASEKHYSDYRFQILTGNRSLSTQRSCPIPLLRNKSTCNLRLECDGEGNVLASFKLLSENAYTVRLRGGSNYARPLRAIKAAIESDGVGDSKIWVDQRGQAVLGLACKVPSRKNKSTSGVLAVCTARDAFIVASKEKTDVPFTINADHVKRWQSERNRKQQRLRQDRKSGDSRRYVKQKQSEVSRKHQNRLSSFTHEIVSHIVQHARRRKVKTVRYDDTIRSYFGSEFPWFEFRGKLKDKCMAEGIEFEHSASEIKPASLDEPHIYFVTPIMNGQVNGHLKIGMTQDINGKRKRSLEMAGGHELLVLATDQQPKSKLRAREKHYHAQFAEHRLEGQKEWFRAEPVIQWLRETGCLGNAGNLSQIQQYMEA